MPNYTLSPPFPRGLYRGQKGYSFGALTAVALAASPGGLSRAAGGIVTATTSAAHKAVPGEIATIVGSSSVGGTRFDGNYFIQAAAFGSLTLTLIPLDDVVLHQAPDTGGGGKVSVIQMEQPATPQAGTAFGLMELSRDLSPFDIDIDGCFDAAPGAFEVDIQVAEVDTPTAYQTAVAITTVDANNLFHAIMQDTPNFVRVFLKIRTNAVNLYTSIQG